MKIFLVVFTLLLLSIPAAAAGRFVGVLELIPTGCENAGECSLKNDFGYVDSNGMGWQAKNGLKTDGASIPPWAQPFVGLPFAKEYIKAAIIHDHYCNRHVRTWKETHWAFYDALLASQLDKPKALLMYYAVYLGGPKWTKLVPGTRCPIGQFCIQRVENQTWPTGAIERKGEDGQQYLVKKATYDDPDFTKNLQDTQKFIADRGGRVTLEDLQQRAHAVKPEIAVYTREIKVTTPPRGIDR